MTIWIGSIVFFSFFTAPIIFKTLDREKASEVISQIFPKYYVIGYFCSIFANLTLIILLESIQDWRLGLLLLMTACSIFAGKGVGPKTRRIKDQIKSLGGAEKNPDLKRKFDNLHSLSVKLNGSALILGIVILFLSAASLKLNG